MSNEAPIANMATSAPQTDDSWETKTLRQELLENQKRAQEHLDKATKALQTCPSFLQEMTRKDLGKIGLYF